MKVLHVETGRHLYGGARQVLFLMQGLRERGVTNVLCCPQGSEIGKQGAEFAHTLAETRSAGDVDLRFFRDLRRIIRQHQPDIVHLHSRRGADVLGGLAARLAGVPVVLSRRVDNPEPRWWVARKYRLYDRVIAISEGIRQVLLSEGLTEQQVVCVRSAVQAALYQAPASREAFLAEFDLAADSLVIGVVAQLIQRKGHRYLLSVLPDLIAQYPHIQVLLFGQGPLREALDNDIQAAGLQHHVRLVGFRDDLPRWLGCLDLLVHPAEMEGLGVSLLQAAAAGVAVIASNSGGMPEAVQHEHTGLLIEPGDTSALLQALQRLVGDASLREHMGAAGRARVTQEFSIDAMVEGNLAVYQAVLAGRQSGGSAA